MSNIFIVFFFFQLTAFPALYQKKKNVKWQNDQEHIVKCGTVVYTYNLNTYEIGAGVSLIVGQQRLFIIV